ncbi:hypothetical protein CLNEO_16820 [Anaerotignum neopropionicum]|uniref:Uncharacterized protein n=1 Tax=Anaerotignum neopropionicum TaxID=36847 RepID=A0A136WFK4_9FIRM|nr:hypothetical protein [Anaerotignum neopropionicum]KXL53139.1 hypothetical protein CLNEO_16820 [Anaerotignum neopropionicum]
MKFKLGLTMTLCVALGTANVVAFAEENGSALEVATETAGQLIASEAPEAEVPEAEVPEAEEPEAEVPEAEVPEAEVPEAEVPEAEVPEAEVPEAEVPEAEAPEAEVPEAEVPEAEVPEAEVPVVEVPEGEIVEIPEEEVPLVEAPQELATLKIIHREHGLFGSTDTEEVIVDLTAGETVHTANYARHDDNLESMIEVEDVVLVAGENEIVIDYLILSGTIDPSIIVEINETSFEIVGEVSAR